MGTPTHLGGKVSLGLEVFEGGRQQEGGEKEECGPEEDIRNEGPSLAAGRADKFSVEVHAVLERGRGRRWSFFTVSPSAPSILELAGMLAASPPTNNAAAAADIKIQSDSATLTFTLSCSQLMFSEVKFLWFHSCRAAAEMLAGGEQRHLQHNQNHLQQCQSAEESLTLSSSRGQSGSARAETEFSFT